MRDSIFYTDDELQEMEKYSTEEFEVKLESSSVENNVDEFLRQCDDLRADMSDISLTLNNKDVQVIDGRVQVIYKEDILQLDVSKDIRRIAQVIKDLGKYREKNIDRDSLSVEDRNKLDKKYDAIVKGFVYLRNKQIIVYNQKVNEINERIEEIKRKLKRKEISEDLKFVLDELNVMTLCEEVTDKDLQKNKYLKNLDYKKLKEVYDNVSKVEEKLKTDREVSVDLWFLSNYIDKTIKNLNVTLSETDNLSNITSISERMVFVYDNLIELTILQELNRGKLDENTFGHYSGKIGSLKSKFKKLENKLFEKRASITENNSEFKNHKFGLQYLASKNDILSIKITECTGKSDSKILNILNGYNNATKKQLEELKNNISSDSLEQSQVDELNNLVNNLDANSKTNKADISNPFMLTKFGDIAFYQQRITDIDKLLDSLEKRISKKEKIDDESEIKEIDGLISDRQNDIGLIASVLKDYKKFNKMDEYNALKGMLDNSSKKLDNIYKTYSSKRPLKVTKVVSAGKYLFKKHDKRALIVAGLTTMALLTSTVGQLVIPAIMHGNIMLGSTVPALSGLTSLSNNILGWIIGASKGANGTWMLANKGVINAGTAIVSLLKSLAVNSGVTVALYAKEIIESIKKLTVKMKLSDRLQKLKTDVIGTKEERTKKSEQRKEKLKRMQTFFKFESLLNEYELNSNELTFEQFCENKKLNEEEISKLKEHIKTYRDSKYFSNPRRRTI